jgi:Uma2 family endonuclease
MSTGTPIHEPRVLLRKATWEQYVSLRDVNENRHTRMTFDRGSLELMSPTGIHERVRILIGHCVFVWLEEMQIPSQSRGSTTFRREDLERGLEPDNCFYLQHESAIRDRDEIDLTIDPPPDLAIEVDITSSSINRLSIYAALKVPEVWRWHEDRLQILLLNRDGDYSEVGGSQALPGFPFAQMVEMIQRRMFVDDLTFTREFRRVCQKSSAAD